MTREEDGREELARALFAWDVEEHDDPAPTWGDLTENQRDVWRSAVDAVFAAGWVSPAAVAGRDAEIERQGLEYAEEVASWQAQVRLLREQQAIAKAENDGLRDAVTVLQGAWSECDDDRAAAERRLGAVAALADEYAGMSLSSFFSTDVAESIRGRLGPVSGAVEGAGGRLTRARRWIETCVDPVAIGAERKAAMLAYLDGADDVPDDLAAIPVAGHEQEVRAEVDGERERWHRVADDIMEHFRLIGSNVSDTYVGLVMSEAWKRRRDLTTPDVNRKQEAQAEGDIEVRYVETDYHRVTGSLDDSTTIVHGLPYHAKHNGLHAAATSPEGARQMIQRMLAARASGSFAPVQGGAES